MSDTNETGYTPSAEQVAMHPRMAALQALADRPREDDGDFADDPDAAIADQVRAEMGLDGADEQTRQQPDDVQAALNDTTLIADPTKAKVKVKVDGEEQELTLDQVLRGYQKEAAATRRLNEAARIKREAEALMAQARQSPPAPTDEDARAQAREFLNSLVSGDDDDAAEKLAQLIRSGRQQATPIDAAVDQVLQQRKLQEQVDGALTEFERLYPELAADEDAVGFISTVAQRQRDEGADPVTALKAGVEKVLKLRGIQPRASTQEPAPTTPTDRAARKSQAANVRPNNARAAALDEDADDSRESVIAQMQRRGGRGAVS